MTDWGVHEIDIALYFMGVTAPKSVIASGGKLAYPDDASETPDTLQAVFEYENFNMLWEHATALIMAIMAGQKALLLLAIMAPWSSTAKVGN